jgi:hypothetical protein
MRVLEDHEYGLGAGPHLDCLRDGSELLRLGCEPARVKEVGFAQQVGQHLSPWPYDGISIDEQRPHATSKPDCRAKPDRSFVNPMVR